MQHSQPQLDSDRRSDNDNRERKPDEQSARTEQRPVKPLSRGERWRAARPTKWVTFGLCLASIALAVFIGFRWGGWVTGGSAQKMAAVSAQTAVVQRLAPMCVAQFNLDPAKDAKLKELQALTTYERTDYVNTQGWALVLGEEKADSKVLSECAKQLMLISSSS